MNNDISTPCKSYTAQAQYWPVCRALMGGTPEMRKAGKLYLPQEPAETDAAYVNRLNRSTLYNGFVKAVHAIAGKILGDGVRVEGDVPEQLKEILEYVDESGRDAERFLRDVVVDAMEVGRSHVLVDYPPRPEGVVSRADEITAGLRPYWVHIKAENLIWWKLRKGKLQEIRIKELAEDEETPQIRVITPTAFQLYQQVGQLKEWQVVSEGINTLGEIPLVTFCTRRISEMVTRPPLEDLAYKNVEHWQSSSDQRHILHVSRVPILFGTGFDDDGTVVIGPNQLVKAPQGSDLKYVEHSGAAIKAGQEDLQRIEEQMAMLAMEPVLQSRPGNQTATGRAIDSAEAQAAIKLVASDIEDAADLCLAYTAMWLGIPKERAGGVEIECDFGLLNKDASGLTELGKARAMGDISRDAYLKELKRRGILYEDFDVEEDSAKLTEEVGML